MTSLCRLLLLQRGDTDASLKDLEGYTAFDLYNSTVNGSKPFAQEGVAELYTWGANRSVHKQHYFRAVIKIFTSEMRH